MSLSILMKTLAVIALLLLPHFCQAGEEASPWPPENVAHVVAYVYDYTQDSRGSSPVFPDGSLHKGIIRSATTRLNGGQAKTLLDTLTKPVEFHESEDCYDPHHAFVFYNKDWKPIGWFAVCWRCGTYAGGSEKFPDYIELAPVRKLTEELEMPVFYETGNYTELFLNEQAPEERKKLRREKEEREAKFKQAMEQSTGPDPFAEEESAPEEKVADPFAEKETVPSE